MRRLLVIVIDDITDDMTDDITAATADVLTFLMFAACFLVGDWLGALGAVTLVTRCWSCSSLWLLLRRSYPLTSCRVSSERRRPTDRHCCCCDLCFRSASPWWSGTPQTAACSQSLLLKSSPSHDALWLAPPPDRSSCGPARQRSPSVWGSGTSSCGTRGTSVRSWGWWRPSGRWRRPAGRQRRLLFWRPRPRGRWRWGRDCNRCCPLTLTHWVKKPASSQLLRRKRRGGAYSSSN